jgi:hypothetical protein
MSDRIHIEWDDALAVVKFREMWHFFNDMEVMFLLDYSSYDDTHHPSPGEFRYGTMIVDENNAEAWMESLSGKLEIEQLKHTYWKNTDKRVRPTFFIDFDTKLWVGGNWKQDQSPFTDYQPQGWTALEDDVISFLPEEVRRYFE